MKFKAPEALRFLGGLAAAILVLGLVALRVTNSGPVRPAPPGAIAAVSPPPPGQGRASCRTGPAAAAQANAGSVRSLAWSPFGRPEIGWETYAPLVAREIGTGCGPESRGFAAALATWQAGQRLPADGMMSDPVFARLKAVFQTRRPFLLLSTRQICPPPPDEASLSGAAPGEGYAGKPILLRPAALAAYRRLAAAARAEDPRIAADPRNLTIFSGYRSPTADSARCTAEGNCNGLVRANCSPHRTGLAIDVYVGQAPGFRPDSSADDNRRLMSQTPTYRWLVANADRFGFVPYPFEPWHWEWTGEAP